MSDSKEPRRYPEVPAQPDYARLEEATLAFWAEDKTFTASVEGRLDAPEYVFNDGPPFANGLPHYGHLLTGFVKDAIPRFETMRGRRVERRFGWDCHGLPAETEAERELGVSGRGPITEFGIDRFNAYCRTSVLSYTKAWEAYVTRQARWVDFVNDYKTMDLDFMESVLWAFKELYRRGLLYESYRVLPYCWECETPLSNFETRQDDAYRDRVDPAVTVSVELVDDGDPSAPRTKVLIWTTTPWTLPSNLALAVGPDLDYAVFARGAERWILGSARTDAYEAELEGWTLVGRLRGEELVGRRYRPILDYFAERAEDPTGAFRILGADFVSTDEGTGIVHLAPAFGEDDQRVCEGAGIEMVCPVDDRGRFDEQVGDLAGLQVFEANDPIIDRLAAAASLVRREDYHHSYPHCWRTDTPLIYRAVSSFFVEVTAVKDRLLALNEEIDWVPEHVRAGAFGHWLEGARDWSISRNRFWGAPVPVWKSDNPAYPRIDVYGSLDELEADFGVRLEDLHRPAVDALVRPNPDDPTGGSMMRRVSDVLDCWFESGSMPFAQLHYPFENADRIKAHLPADFICEYVGQTRGWFYTQQVLAAALFDRPAFSHCIAHGVVLGDDGRKLSKRLRNFPDPEEFFAEHGADTMRWYLLSSPVLRGQDVVIEADAMAEPIRHVMNPIWNTWYFLALYGNTDDYIGVVRSDAAGVLDRYVLAKARQLCENLTASFESYDLPSACASVSGFLDALTNWYVRRSRERFWRPFSPSKDEAPDADKRDAYDTLHTVLELLCRLVAPLLPLLSETIYKGLTGRRSVHLERWPDAAELPKDDELVETMDLVREACSAAHSIRKARGLRARLPLARLTIATSEPDRLEPYVLLMKDEVNAKDVRLESDATRYASERLHVVPARLGPRLGAATQTVLQAVRQGEWQLGRDGLPVVAGQQLEAGEYELGLAVKDEETSRLLAEGGVVVLDCEPDEALEQEGLARDVIRGIQKTRKDAGLNVADRIELSLAGDEVVRAAVTSHREEIAMQTLAVSLELLDGAPEAHPELVQHDLGDGHLVAIGLKKTSEID